MRAGFRKLTPFSYSGRCDPLAELTAGPSGLGRSDVGDCRRAASHWTRPGAAFVLGEKHWFRRGSVNCQLFVLDLLLAVDPDIFDG